VADRYSWCGPALVTAALGSFEVTRPELWRDELASWSFAGRSVAGLFATARHTDGAQLPYYLLLHFWMAAFGSSLLSMRGLSVLAMAAAAAFVTLAARDLAGPRAGVASGLVFAVLPSVSRFAQEARFYAVALCCAALATWLLARALDRPSWIRWAAYAAAMTAVGYSDMVALALLAGHAAWTALRWRHDRDPRRLTRFAAAAIASAACCIPLILLGSKEAGSQVAWVPHPGFSPAEYGWFASNLFYSSLAAIGVLLLAALAWLPRAAPQVRRTTGYLTAAAVVPLAAVWAVSLGTFSYFFPRYVLFTLIAVAILAGMAAARLGRVPVIAAVVLIAALGAFDQAAIREPAAHNWADYPSNSLVNFDYQGAARIVGTNARPGDGIAYSDLAITRYMDTDLGVSYYIGGYLRPGVPAPRELFIARTAAQVNARYPVPCADPARCVGTESRVWLVGAYATRSPFTMIPPAEAAVLEQDYSIRRMWVRNGMTVVLLVRRAPHPTPALSRQVTATSRATSRIRSSVR
jgi:mannosyltransferase